MLNIIQNTIGAIRRVGESVVRAGLKMWLPFTKAEPLGENLVVNGDFSDGNSGWYESAGWNINNGKANRSLVSTNSYIQHSISLVEGKRYKISYERTYESGFGTTNLFSFFTNTSTRSTLGSYTSTVQETVTVTDYFTAGHSSDIELRVYGIQDFTGSIDNVVIQEYAQETPDISGNDNNAILKTGRALQFSGNDSVETSFPSTTPIRTIAFWIKPTHSSTNETLFYGGGAFGNTRQMYLDHLKVESINGNMIMNTYVNGQYEGVTFTGTPATLTQDEWQRVVLTSSETAPIYLYTDDFDIGSGVYGSDGRFIISDLQIYNKTWSTDDIAFDYANPQKFVTDNTSSSISLSNLKGYWAFTEGAGGIAYDSSGGTAYNGTISGGTYVDAQERILQLGMISWAKSTPVSDEIVLPYSPNNVSEDILGNAVRVKGSGFNLDGTGYGEVPHSTDFDFGTGDFSVSAWAKFSYIAQGSSFNAIYTNGGQVNATNTFSIISVSPNKIAVLVNGTSAVSTSTFSEGEWVHIVATRNSGTISLYINGNKTPEDTDTNSNTVTSSQNPRIGYDGNNARFYNGIIDDVQVYDDYLTPDEVEQNYNATKSGHNN